MGVATKNVSWEGDGAGPGKQHHVISILLLCIVTLTLLLPFANKAFHVDDTLFLYAARQIQKNPLRPYDFAVNWNGTPEHMWRVTKNPPLTSYVLAALTGLFGEVEIPLHVAFAGFALLATLSTYWLATLLGANGRWSALVLAVAPGFVVTATGVSSDVVALAFYILAVAAFIQGSRQSRWSLLVLAGVAAGLAGLAKYVGFTVVPLLALYSILKERRLSHHLLTLLIPIGFFAAWAVHGWYYYGLPHVLTGGTYWGTAREGYQFRMTALWNAYYTAVTPSYFAGALGLPIFLSIPVLRRRRWPFVVAGLVSSAAVLAHVLHVEVFGLAPLGGGHLSWFSFLNYLMLVSFVFAAVTFLCWTACDCKGWPAERVLLVLWVAGILVFSALFNWTVNVRAVLFALPPAAILLGRALRANQEGWQALALLTGLTAVLAVMVACADHRWAGAYREEAQRLAKRFGPPRRGHRFFQSHWGLQYYLENEGWEYFVDQGPEEGRSELSEGDVLLMTAVGHANKSLFNELKPYAEEKAVTMGERAVPGVLYLHTQNRVAGAGFYASRDGPLPYAFSAFSCEVFVLCTRP